MNSYFWKISFYALGIAPLVFCITLLAFYFHTAYVIGHLPIPSYNDPKNLEELYRYYSPIISYSAIPTFYLFPVWLVCTIFYYIKNRRLFSWLPIVFSSSLYLMVILIIYSKIFDWFMS